MPVFHDPRPAKLDNTITTKMKKKCTLGTDQIHYKPKPGTMIFIPAYIEHQYTVDAWSRTILDLFILILQAVRKMITDTVENKQLNKQTVKEKL
jgi:hypothetical protein